MNHANALLCIAVSLLAAGCSNSQNEQPIRQIMELGGIVVQEYGPPIERNSVLQHYWRGDPRFDMDSFEREKGASFSDPVVQIKLNGPQGPSENGVIVPPTKENLIKMVPLIQQLALADRPNWCEIEMRMNRNADQEVLELYSTTFSSLTICR